MKRVIISLLVMVTALAVVGANVSPQAQAASGLANLAGCANASLGSIDDSPSAGPVDLGFTVNFFGVEYSQLYVNNNGNVTFDSALSTFTPFDLNSTSRAIIAPFFADVDTRGDGSSEVTYGQTTYGANPAFCVLWDDVGFFSSRADKLNSFQLVIISRPERGSGDFDIFFAYDSIEWETGNASGGTDGLGGSSARVGYSNGQGQSYELPGSGVPGTFLDNGTAPLINGSLFSGFKSGWYFYPVESGQPPTGTGQISGQVNGAGQPIEGSFVQACFAGNPGAPCQTTVTNAQGNYVFNGLETGGNYFITAFPPGGSFLGPRTIGALFLGGETVVLTGQKITLIASVPAPPGITVVTPFTAGDGTPAISSTTGAPVVQTGACTGGSGTWSVKQGGAVLASGNLIEDPPGTYTANVPPLPGTNGRATMNFDVDCPGGTPDKDESFDIYIDPSGNVYDSNDNSPIEGATVTLMRSDLATGPFETVPNGSGIMSPSNRTNPDLTNDEGFFRWDVIAGYYQLRVEKAGCTDPNNPSQNFILTDVYKVPPPAVGLELFLDCGGGSGPTPTNTPTGPTNTPAGPTPTASNTPGGSCPDDSLEDNDLPADATTVLLPYNRPALRICPLDVDYFEFVLQDGDTVQVDATFTDAQGDIDLAAFDPDGFFLADAISVTDNEKMTFTAEQSGVHIVQVALFEDFGSPGNNYGLEISIGAGLYGDANCSGSVDAIDASVILQLTAGLVSSLACEDAGDVNINGSTDSIDASLILQFVAGLISALPI